MKQREVPEHRFSSHQSATRHGGQSPRHLRPLCSAQHEHGPVRRRTRLPRLRRNGGGAAACGCDLVRIGEHMSVWRGRLEKREPALHRPCSACPHLRLLAGVRITRCCRGTDRLRSLLSADHERCVRLGCRRRSQAVLACLCQRRSQVLASEPPLLGCALRRLARHTLLGLQILQLLLQASRLAGLSKKGQARRLWHSVQMTPTLTSNPPQPTCACSFSIFVRTAPMSPLGDTKMLRRLTVAVKASPTTSTRLKVTSQPMGMRPDSKAGPSLYGGNTKRPLSRSSCA
jgi:hypothetical protein